MFAGSRGLLGSAVRRGLHSQTQAWARPTPAWGGPSARNPAVALHFAAAAALRRSGPGAAPGLSLGRRFLCSSGKPPAGAAASSKPQPQKSETAGEQSEETKTSVSSSSSEEAKKEEAKKEAGEEASKTGEEKPKRHVADWMDMMMPERNWGITNPRTWVLIAVVIALQIYIYQLEEERKFEAQRREEDKQSKLLERRRCRQIAERLAKFCNHHAEIGSHCEDLTCLRAMVEAVDNAPRCGAVITTYPPVQALHNAIGACGGPIAMTKIRHQLAEEDEALLAESGESRQ